MGKIFSSLSFVMGVLSLVMLAKQGLELGFVAPLETVTEFYRKLVQVFLGWADGPLGSLVARLAPHVPDIHLQPHWKHILVPMWLYVGADCRIMWKIGRLRAAVFFALTGGLLALLASVAAGAVAVDDPLMRPLLFPVAALVVFNFLQAIWDALFKPVPGRTRWQVFGHYAGLFALGNLVLGAVVVAVGLTLQGLGLPGVNLVLLLVLVGLLALRDMSVAALGVEARRKPDQTWRQCFLAMANVRLGLAVFATLGAALALLGCNAGLGLAGI
ncbi:hypothetical protein [Hyphomonas johnsonii]|uniref:Uncharacterized protein n=1 Tax=Hyphomonas johnsonii MHS-2 TaxID=1280950 RepID=A0A059FHF1_9PROT|nr:hypothetical protein [Hyphomonas johnsonii]KCZ89976.1 hypothetical protein HJO_13541 [Hyphomonas johnsonii MHS-2]